jgi:hypothetical protein
MDGWMDVDQNDLEQQPFRLINALSPTLHLTRGHVPFNTKTENGHEMVGDVRVVFDSGGVAALGP